MNETICRAVFKRDEYRCKYCKRRDNLHPHHIIYRSHGGKDTFDNLITLCCYCHALVHEGRLAIESSEGKITFSIDGKRRLVTR